MDKSETRAQESGLNFLPMRREEIPPVDELAKIGTKNLQLLWNIMDEAKKIVTMYYGARITLPKSSPLARYQPGMENGEEILQRYLGRISDAQAWAVDCVPIIPDLRKEAWVEPGDEVVIYLVIVDPESRTRRLRPYGAIVSDTIVTEKPQVGPKIVDLTFELKRRDKVVEDFEDPSYDIRSQFILRRDEVGSFKHSEQTLEVWMQHCGMLYPDWKLNSEIQAAWKRRFGFKA